LCSRERRRQKQRCRQKRSSRISIPSCHVCHVLLRHVVLGVPKSTEGSGPVRSRSQNTMVQKPWPTNHGPKNHGPDGQQIGPSFAKINWGDVAYKPRKRRRAPQWPLKTYPRLHVCHAFGSGMPVGDEFCPFDQNGG
jgi:hypothetical protein